MLVSYFATCGRAKFLKYNSASFPNAAPVSTSRRRPIRVDTFCGIARAAHVKLKPQEHETGSGAPSPRQPCLVRAPWGTGRPFCPKRRSASSVPVLPASPPSEVPASLRGGGSSSLLPVGQAPARCAAAAVATGGGGATAAPAVARAGPCHGRRCRRRRRDGRRHHLCRGGAPGRSPGGLLVALVCSGVDGEGRKQDNRKIAGRPTEQ